MNGKELNSNYIKQQSGLVRAWLAHQGANILKQHSMLIEHDSGVKIKITKKNIFYHDFKRVISFVFQTNYFILYRKKSQRLIFTDFKCKVRRGYTAR